MPRDHEPATAHLPPLAAVRAFEAAARHQSFTRGAEELGMTQAAVSYQIKLLEDRVGTPLFIRGPRQVTLTPTGRRLVGPVSKALNALGAAFSEAMERNHAVLSITTLQTIGTMWLAPRLASFHASNPLLEVRVDASELLVDFSAEEFDLGLRYGDGRWPGLATHKLFDGCYTPVCSPALYRELAISVPADLLKTRLLGAVDPWWRRWFVEAGAGDPGGAARPTLALQTQSMDVQAALRGHGVAMVMPDFFAEDIASGRLVRPFAHAVKDVNAYWLVYPEGRARERKIKLFRDWVLAEAEATRAIEAPCVAASALTPPARNSTPHR